MLAEAPELYVRPAGSILKYFSASLSLLQGGRRRRKVRDEQKHFSKKTEEILRHGDRKFRGFCSNVVSQCICSASEALGILWCPDLLLLLIKAYSREKKPEGGKERERERGALNLSSLGSRMHAWSLKDDDDVVIFCENARISMPLCRYSVSALAAALSLATFFGASNRPSTLRENR